MMKAEVTYISEMFFEKTIFEEHDSVLVFEKGFREFVGKSLINTSRFLVML